MAPEKKTAVAPAGKGLAKMAPSSLAPLRAESFDPNVEWHKQAAKQKKKHFQTLHSAPLCAPDFFLYFGPQVAHVVQLIKECPVFGEDICTAPALPLQAAGPGQTKTKRVVFEDAGDDLACWPPLCPQKLKATGAIPKLGFEGTKSSRNGEKIPFTGHGATPMVCGTRTSRTWTGWLPMSSSIARRVTPLPRTACAEWDLSSGMSLTRSRSSETLRGPVGGSCSWRPSSGLPKFSSPLAVHTLESSK